MLWRSLRPKIMTSDLKSISICATGWTFSGEIMLGGQKLIQSISPPIVFPIFCAHRTAIKFVLENLSKHFFLRFCQRARARQKARERFSSFREAATKQAAVWTHECVCGGRERKIKDGWPQPFSAMICIKLMPYIDSYRVDWKTPGGRHTSQKEII